MRDTTPVGPPTLRLGQICSRLLFTITAETLLMLGFAPAGTDRAAKLYHEADFPRICAALSRHIASVQAQFTALPTTEESEK